MLKLLKKFTEAARRARLLRQYYKELEPSLQKLSRHFQKIDGKNPLPEEEEQ